MRPPAGPARRQPPRHPTAPRAHEKPPRPRLRGLWRSGRTTGTSTRTSAPHSATRRQLGAEKGGLSTRASGSRGRAPGRDVRGASAGGTRGATAHPGTPPTRDNLTRELRFVVAHARARVRSSRTHSGPFPPSVSAGRTRRPFGRRVLVGVENPGQDRPRTGRGPRRPFGRRGPLRQISGSGLTRCHLRHMRACC